MIDMQKEYDELVGYKKPHKQNEAREVVDCVMMRRALEMAEATISFDPSLEGEVLSMHARMCAIYFDQVRELRDRALAKRNKSE